MAKIVISSPFDSWKEGDFRAGPWINIALEDYPKDGDERICLGGDLMSVREIDYAFNQI